MTRLGWIAAALFDQVHRMRCEDVRRSGSENDYFSCVSNAGTLTADYASKIQWHWIGLGAFSALTLAGVAIGRGRATAKACSGSVNRLGIEGGVKCAGSNV